MKKIALLVSTLAVAGLALVAPAGPAAANPIPPAAIPPPRCVPESQGNGTYEWEYQYTSTISKGGHGTRTHHFYVYYVPVTWFSTGTKVSCSLSF
ncbi:hypothetical protein [Nonomuraea bangladeshensis]|uniref:hypothetical protein n=1 Tax=Nonomuraea bangladeshensis TaxID=404385 RepID=UPI003C308CEE